MLRHISPPESPTLGTLWTDEEYEKILSSLKGVKVSLGFTSNFNTNDGSLTVTGLTNGSEAEKVLQVQDRIVRLDGQNLKGLSITRINELLDGERGQSSILKVVRDIEVFEVTLSREELKKENLLVHKIPNQPLALVEIKSISLGIADELEKELEVLKSEGVQGIILDLRNNVGGVLNEGINVSKLFLKERNIVLRTQARSKGVTNYVADQDKYTEFKLTVLINENSASASEIIAAAVRDHNRGTLVGKKTFGKGVIENTYTLKNEYRVKFITNAMYSPKGVSWQKVGILPDFFIDQNQASYNRAKSLSIEERIKQDAPLLTAIKLLNQ